MMLLDDHITIKVFFDRLVKKAIESNYLRTCWHSISKHSASIININEIFFFIPVDHESVLNLQFLKSKMAVTKTNKYITHVRQLIQDGGN